MIHALVKDVKTSYHSYCSGCHDLVDGQDGHVGDVGQHVHDGHQGDGDHNGQWEISEKRAHLNQETRHLCSAILTEEFPLGDTCGVHTWKDS